MSHLYAIILAGGSGTRLWPRSRKEHPKQLLDLVSERTMLQETYDRIVALLPPANIYVITNWQYVDDVRTQLPYVPHSQIIGEPEGKGTAPPAALAALLVRQHDPDAVTLILPADHVIKNPSAFHLALQSAVRAANEKYLVTLGVKPAFAETGYGYIEAGEPLAGSAGLPVKRVVRFLEKPNSATAEDFIARGNFFWNSGIFIWRADCILAEFERQQPQMLDRLEAIVARGFEAPAFASQWLALSAETIDYGIMEKAERVAVVPLDAGWNDIGSWAALFDLMERDSADNAVHGDHIGVNTRSSLIYSNKRLIATIGLENIIIVDTDDAILICAKDRAQDVKKIVDELKNRSAHDYL